MLNLVIDFKGEAITFRTTTQAVLETLAHCVDLMSQREECLRKRLDREIEKRKHFENLSKTYFLKLNARSIHPGPDLEVSCLLLDYIVISNDNQEAVSQYDS